MKYCSQCGQANADESNFCEKCGNRFAPQTQEKEEQEIAIEKEDKINQEILIEKEEHGQDVSDFKQKRTFLVVLGIIALLALVVLGIVLGKQWMDKRSAKDIDRTMAVSATESESVSASEAVTEIKPKTLPNKSQKTEDASEVDYSAMDINAVDNAYVSLKGTVKNDSKLLLILDAPKSLCANNNWNKVVVQKKVSQMEIKSGTNMDKYVGATVSIKGKLEIDSNNKPVVTAVNVTVEKAATAATATTEDTSYETHKYDIVKEDVDWQGAFDECIRRGGHLVQINSEAEFQKIIGLIEAQGASEVHFYVGGRRNLDSNDYHWVDTNNTFIGSVLNPGGTSWMAAHWMQKEPSFSSDDELESYMNLIYFHNVWVFNDVSSDITKYYPGKTGFVCEYDQ